ncbi:MAG: hypothetical protein H6656_03755 [Ardenticatenaceae bacterium]|nr:hypothetical protein [Ardenticatenaceae bacterium]
MVSNKEIPKEAVDAISGAIGPDYARNTRFMNGDELWHLVEKYLLPITALIEQANKSINTLDTHYKPVITLTGDETHITIQEKFPGAAKEKPINIQAKLVFSPNDPASENTITEFKNLIEKGTPATIPAHFIEDVEIPEFARVLLGNIRFEEMSLQLSSLPTDKIIPVKIEFISDDQDIYALNYVPLKLIQSGTKQLTFTNDEADQIVRIELIVDLEDRVGRTNFRIYWDDLNAVQLLENLTLQKCLSKPVSIKIIGLETGINLFKMDGHLKFFEPPEPDLINMVSDLATIQRRIKRPLVFPIRDLSEDEWKTIEKLRQILNEGTIKGTWDNLKITVILSSEGVKSLLAQGETSALRFTDNEVETLFGTELPLGPIETIFQLAKLVNFEEIQDRYEELKSGDKEIELIWIPGEDNNLVVTNYLNWIPGVESSP